MNKGMLTVGIIFLGLIALLLLQILNNYSTGSELDYYLLKETTDAAMEDAIDLTFYSTCGVYRMDKEKFVESFLKRFMNSADAARTYTVGFYDINEVPPKVSVKIDSLTTLSFKAGDNNGNETKDAANISTTYDAILETTYDYDAYNKSHMNNSSSDLCMGIYN